MTAVDFLPAAYRQRLARRRVTRERALLAVPVVLALLATDLVLRWRVHNVRRMAELAQEHAKSGEARGDVAHELSRQIQALQATIDAAAAPLAAARMTAWLDELLAARPAGVTFHELSCRHQPWSDDSAPVITVQASAATPAEFSTYLAALRANGALPPLHCRRTFHTGARSELGFELQSEATPAVPR